MESTAQTCWNCLKNDLAANNLLGNCTGFTKNGVSQPPRPIPPHVADGGCLLWVERTEVLPVGFGPYEPGIEPDADGFFPVPK